jgi:hypothetical protein
MAKKPATAINYLVNPAKFPAKAVYAVLGEETVPRRQTNGGGRECR